jgi:uncharacterized protein YndB with AHSA1/START domain
MIETILVLLAIAVVAVVAFAAAKPDRFQIRRSTTIDASPEKIFPLVEDLREHRSWVPFDSDPDTRRSYSGATHGKGATYEWEGKKAGAGRIEIIESTPHSMVTLDLDMRKPMKARNKVEFLLEPRGSSTIVTWAIQGRQPFLGKLVSTFVDCEKMMGREFEKGLATLKALAEA